MLQPVQSLNADTTTLQLQLLLTSQVLNLRPALQLTHTNNHHTSLLTHNAALCQINIITNSFYLAV